MIVVNRLQNFSKAAYNFNSCVVHSCFTRCNQLYLYRNALNNRLMLCNFSTTSYVLANTKSSNFQSGYDLIELEENWKLSKKSCQKKSKSNTSRSQYNFGLTGNGKLSKQKYQKNQFNINIEGEILFGLFPVLLALQAKRRSFKRLFIRKTMFDSVHLSSTSDNKLIDHEKESNIDNESHNNPVLKSPHVVKAILNECECMGVQVIPCDRDVLDYLAGARPHQGLCLESSKLLYEVVDLEGVSELQQPFSTGKPFLWLILESIRDPMNFGAVLRCAYYLQVDRILSPIVNSCPLTPVVSKASAGAMELVPVYKLNDITGLLKILNDKGWHILGTVSHQDNAPKISLTDVTLKSHTALIIGSEARGLSADVKQMCHNFITIKPGSQINDAVDSLNVSVATGIILHHLTTQLKKD